MYVDAKEGWKLGHTGGGIIDESAVHTTHRHSRIINARDHASVKHCLPIPRAPLTAPRLPITRIGRSPQQRGRRTGGWDSSREYVDGLELRTGLGQSL